jgi:hypothetical protein
MDPTPEERQRIYLEEKARLEIQPQLKAPDSTNASDRKTGYTILAVVGLVGFIGVSIGVPNLLSHSPTQPTSPSVSIFEPDIPASGNATHDRLLLLEAGPRAKALGFIVISSGNGCLGEDSFFGGIGAENEAFWSVRCEHGKAYLVSINADSSGSSGVLDCAAWKAVSGLDCFTKFDPRQPLSKLTKKQIDADINRLSPALNKQLTDRLGEVAGER